MAFGQSGGRRGGRGSPDIDRALGFAANSRQNVVFQTRRNERPAAHIFSFFLAPDNFCIFKSRQFLNQSLDRERIKLFQAQDVNVFQSTFLPFFEQIVVNLAAAQNDALDLLVGMKVLSVVPENPVKARIGPHFP